ncbi:putative bifunctional diguanylate cyclase/phosphodiesterase [Deinococcus multiflagellatus]|uniref:Bifunctional diguanylate cyclase/phosphodiesterase n=1 Tax=Deinococcus multiflagellatus TaxID=1656887 RepID=A0ABW1ZFB8_9DEIO
MAAAPSYPALQYEHDLRRALASGRELELHYQPQVDLRTMTVSGFEALVRWRHPERGLISPGAFLPVAERTGLIVPLGSWVLRGATAQLGRWQAQTGRPLRMAVNLAAAQLPSPGLVDEVRRALADSGVAGAHLELELTESALLTDPARAAEVLTQIAALGVRMALDDFGTGYSSLSHLKAFPVSTLKIDRAFVQALDSPLERRLVQGVVALGQVMGLCVLAEGAETPEQVRWVRDLGCDAVQGYALGRPLPPEQAAALLAAPPTLPS